jgi:cyclopropane fatty-acyl-phospholipid synthase-like methyltransferase
MTDERARSVHDRVRTVFDGWARDGSADRMESSHSPFVRQAFDTLPLNRRSWYLDIGCGNGYTVRWAADWQVTAGSLLTMGRKR